MGWGGSEVSEGEEERMMRRKLLEEKEEEEARKALARGIAHDKRHRRPGGRVLCLQSGPCSKS